MISKDKEYRTRDGREVRIYATDGGGCQPIQAAFKTDDGNWRAKNWGVDGTYLLSETPCDFDIIEVHPRIKRTVWVNLYANGAVSGHDSRPVADHFAKDQIVNRTECIPVEIDCEEGEGLND